VNDTHNPRIFAVNQNDDIMTEPAAKRQKPDTCIDYSVALVTTIPRFCKQKSYTGMLALTWTDHNQVLSRRVMSCGYITLDINLLANGNVDILQGITGKLANQDVTALKSVSIMTTVSFVCLLDGLLVGWFVG